MCRGSVEECIQAHAGTCPQNQAQGRQARDWRAEAAVSGFLYVLESSVWAHTDCFAHQEVLHSLKSKFAVPSHQRQLHDRRHKVALHAKIRKNYAADKCSTLTQLEVLCTRS